MKKLILGLMLTSCGPSAVTFSDVPKTPATTTTTAAAPTTTLVVPMPTIVTTTVAATTSTTIASVSTTMPYTTTTQLDDCSAIVDHICIHKGRFFKSKECRKPRCKEKE